MHPPTDNRIDAITARYTPFLWLWYRSIYFVCSYALAPPASFSIYIFINNSRVVKPKIEIPNNHPIIF